MIGEDTDDFTVEARLDFDGAGKVELLLLGLADD